MNQQHILSDWKFKACDEEDWLQAQVPGTVHTDLLRHNIISDPFYGINEHELQWIDKKDWEYEANLRLTEDMALLSQLELVFEGLDTYTDVYVNEEHVLSADNMFRAWRADVKPYIHVGDNKVRVVFRSPIIRDMVELHKLGMEMPAPNDQSDLGGLGDHKLSVFARKAPYHYGWDWGPRFVTCGIWREVRLEGWSAPMITELYIRQNQVSTEVADLTAEVEVFVPAAWTGRLKIVAGERIWEDPVELAPGVQVIKLDMHISKPELWWCRGLGEPFLYTFKAELLEQDYSVSEKQVRTGLRTIRLIRERDPAGASFYFELNGVPVFAKGANHIPNDSFIPEVTYERYRHEISTAAACHMNMLRVWGGGIYEEDIFYELCDEYGLLVWQDFMFACSMYPGDAAFLSNVALEAEYNIRRLRNHPCIALWCGNNEIDSAWAHYLENSGWGWKQNYDTLQREKLWADYDALFHRILPEKVSHLAHNIAYWPSSPLRSLSRDENQHANVLSGEGDIHYWGVWHAVEPFENYNSYIGRFMSEYGFQSFPELRSVLSYAPEEQLELESDIMLAHQKNGSGNRLIKEYMGQYLPDPKDFKAFLYMSQVLQAQAMETAIEAHRRNKPYCMGTLYWQMNDCWPVASWAGMDYYGRWKALQYTVQRSYRDIILSIIRTEDGIDIFTVNDKRDSVSGTLELQLLDFNGKRLYENSEQVTLSGDSSTKIKSVPLGELLQSQDQQRTVLVVSMKQGNELLVSKPYYFTSFRNIELPQSSITMHEVPGTNGSSFTLECDTLARQVWLSAEEDGIFSDNFFDLIPGMPMTVQFYRRSFGDEAFVLDSPGHVTVRSMRDFIS